MLKVIRAQKKERRGMQKTNNNLQNAPRVGAHEKRAKIYSGSF